MNENEWTQSICDKMQLFLDEKLLFASTLKKIPYSQEIVGYTDEWKPEYMDPTRFETDLVVYEKQDGKIIPRIIIEAKIGSVTTHDAITYSYKAEKHKNITPYLRYGIMIGDRKQYALPGRLFRHGTNFDFMFSFAGMEPENDEWNTFKEMILKEVDYSRITEQMLHDTRNKGRKHYYMLEKQIALKEYG